MLNFARHEAGRYGAVFELRSDRKVRFTVERDGHEWTARVFWLWDRRPTLPVDTCGGLDSLETAKAYCELAAMRLQEAVLTTPADQRS